MAKKKITSKQLKMSFNLPATTKNTSRDAFKKATEKIKSYGQKAAENISKSKSTSTALAKNASTVNKAKLLGPGKSTALVKAGKIAQKAPKYTDFIEVGKKAVKGGKDIKGKAMLAVYGAAALTAAATSGLFDKKKGTAIKAGAKKATSTVKTPEVKKTETKKPAATKVDNTSIEQKAKDVISGKYGSGADRKKALGADYDKVQAIINKQMASSKPKTAPTNPTGPSKGTLALIEKNIKDEQEGRLKFDEPVASKMKKGGTVKMQYGGTTKKVVDSGNQIIGKKTITAQKKYGGVMKTKKR